MPTDWAWVGIGMMGTGEDGVAAPDSARMRFDAGRELSPAALVVAALVCAIVAAVVGSMLSESAAASAGCSAGLTVSRLAGTAAH